MPVTGKVLLEEIRQKVIAERQMLTHEAELDLSKHAFSVLTPLGFSQHAGEVFKLLREVRSQVRFRMKRLDVNWDSSVSEKEDQMFLDALHFRMSEWGDLSRQQVDEFYREIRDSFETSNKAFVMARSRGTHVLAILRPHNEKDLAVWAEYYPAAKLDKIRKRAQTLASQAISNRSELEKWGEESFKLFQFSTIYKPSLDDSTNDLKPQWFQKTPPGLIAEQSERVYATRWSVWFHMAMPSLLRIVDGLDSENGFKSTDSKVVASEKTRATTPRRSLTPRSGEDWKSRTSMTRLGSFSVSITAVNEPGVSATRNWPIKPTELEISSWSKALLAAWGDVGVMVLSQVRSSNKGQETEILIPATELKDLKRKLISIMEVL